VDYSVDEQWNLWVKQGIRKLVSCDDMPEQMGTKVGPQYNTASPPPGAWPATGPGGSVAILEHSFTSGKQSWDVAEDNELDQTGGDLLQTIGWDWMERNQAAPNTQVSDGGFETTNQKVQAIVD
jgi:hypothetical protein